MGEIAGTVRIMRSRNSGDTPTALLPGQVHIDEFTGTLSHGDASTTPNSSGAFTTLVRYNLKALVAALSAVRSVATGGTGASAAGGQALDNISGFMGTGFLLRTAAATYSLVAQATLALSSRQITGTGALTGGGDLTADRALDVAANGVTNAKLAQMAAVTIKGNMTGAAANASDVSPSAVLDAAFSSARGTLLYRGASGWAALAAGAAGYLLTAAGAGADPAWAAAPSAVGFPVSGVTPKSAAYPIVAADKGTMFDLTGSFPLTLPAASGGSASAPLYYHFRKRDGSGRCTVVPAGTDTIEGVNAAVALYQERATLVSFGSGWIFPPGGRERTVWVAPPGTPFSGVNALALTTGFDADVAEAEVSLENVVASAAASFAVQFYQSGAYVTSGYVYFGSDAGGSSYASNNGASATQSAIPITGNTTTTVGPLAATLTVRNPQSTAAKGASIENRGVSASQGGANGSNNVFDIRGWSTTAAAVAGLKLYPSTGTMTGTYGLRITRS